MPSVNVRRNANGTTTYFVRGRDALGRGTTERFPSRAAAAAFAKRVDRIGFPQAAAELNRRDRASDEYVPVLRDWFEAYLRDSTGITEGTRTDYRYVAERVMLPMLGDLPLDMIDRAAVARFVNQLEKTPRIGNRGKVKGKPIGGTLSAKSISNHHGLLSALLKVAVAEGHLPVNPCLGVRLPRAGEHERRDERFLTHQEFDLIYQRVAPAHQPLILTLVGTGMRWSEATALQTRHVNPDAGTIRVVQAWKKIGKGKRELGPPKTTRSRRTIMVPDQVMDALRPLIAGQAPEAFVFRNGVGNAWHHGSWSSRNWTPAASVVEPHPRIHDLRHTHASWLLEQGATLEQVQDQLGHESILTTRKVYGHLQPAMRQSLREAATRSLALPAEPVTGLDVPWTDGQGQAKSGP